ncbi:MAG: DUF481 domain-containing protein [Bacteroidetes bacterium]|nr:DUF481 domain-containing protein [Bacteroidota bacterium]
MLRHLRFLTLLCLVFTSTASYSQIVNIEDRRGNISDTTGIFGRVAAGMNLVNNGTPVLSIHGNSQLEYLRPKTDWLLLFNYNLVKAGDNSFVDDGFAHMRFNYFLSERVVWEAFGQAQYNEKIRILFRGLLGTGPRFRLFDNKKQAAFAGIAYMYEYEQISDTSIIHRDHRISSYLSFQFTPFKNLTLAGTTYYQPIIDNIASSRISSKTSATFSITDQLSLGVNFSVTFDGRLPEEVPNVPNKIYAWRNTLRYSF